MRAEIARAKSARDSGRYASDSRDAEWDPIALDTPTCKSSPLERRRVTDLREAVNVALPVFRSGCAWRMLPKEFPPCRTAYRSFSVRRDTGLWVSIGHRLVPKARCATSP